EPAVSGATLLAGGSILSRATHRNDLAVCGRSGSELSPASIGRRRLSNESSRRYACSALPLTACGSACPQPHGVRRYHCHAVADWWVWTTMGRNYLLSRCLACDPNTCMLGYRHG